MKGEEEGEEEEGAEGEALFLKKDTEAVELTHWIRVGAEN